MEEFSHSEATDFANAPEQQKEPLLDVENQCQALHEILRAQFGQWIDNGSLTTRLKEVLGVSNIHLNNLASKLRGRFDGENLGLDVDTRAATPTIWEYRICRKEESERLRRDNPTRSKV